MVVVVVVVVFVAPGAPRILFDRSKARDQKRSLIQIRLQIQLKSTTVLRYTLQQRALLLLLVVLLVIVVRW